MSAICTYFYLRRLLFGPISFVSCTCILLLANVYYSWLEHGVGNCDLFFFLNIYCISLLLGIGFSSWYQSPFDVESHFIVPLRVNMYSRSVVALLLLVFLKLEMCALYLVLKPVSVSPT